MEEIKKEFNNLEYYLSLKEKPSYDNLFNLAEFLDKKFKKEHYFDGATLILIKNFLKNVEEIKKYFSSPNPPESFLVYLKNLNNYKELINLIEEKISEDGEIRYESFPQLLELIFQIREVRNKIVNKLNKIIKEEKNILTIESYTLAGERYVLPIKINFVNKFPGIVHDYSESEKTAFCEPLEIIDDNNLLIKLTSLLTEEKKKILKELTQKILEKSKEIAQTVKTIAYLDALNAKAKFIEEYNCQKIEISQNAEFQIYSARHPLLLKLKGEVVPLSFQLPKDIKILLISGPNAGGKTVVLKTIGIISLLTQAGIFPPVGLNSKIPFFKKIYALIGDEQSLEKGLSSFHAHIKKIKTILANADEESLVLLDELGTDTSPEEGDALAMAILEELSKKNCFVFATTHSPRLKIFAHNSSKIMNAAMEYKEKPTYRLILGIPGDSSALEIAKAIGLEDKIIEKAKEYLTSDFLIIKTKLNEWERILKEYQEKIENLTVEEEKLKNLISQYEEKNKKLQKILKNHQKEFLKEKENFFIQARRELENLIKKIKEKEKNATKEAKEFIANNLFTIQEEKKFLFSSAEEEELKIGAKVYIEKLNQIGKIVEIKNNLLKVLTEKFIITVPKGEVKLLKENE
uniref:Endonuclease MutS2 n=1 Tax=candidate division WOR-3 bacterium TaxID=2052148 RepID=A0A7V3ZW18_UNCW3